VVVSCRGSDINHLARPRARRALIGWALRRCHTVLVVSRALGEGVGALGVAPARIRVMPNGIDGDRFRPRDRAAARARLEVPASQRLVVCVSRLSHEKGIDVLLDATTRLAHDVRVVVVGDGAQRPALEALARTLDLGDRFGFMGTRPHDEIPEWLAAADVVVRLVDPRDRDIRWRRGYYGARP